MKIQIGTKVLSISFIAAAHVGRNDKYVSERTAVKIIKQEVKAGHADKTAVKIAAIKRIRELSRVVYEQGTSRIEFAMGLKEAKDLVEQLVAKHGLLRK